MFLFVNLFMTSDPLVLKLSCTLVPEVTIWKYIYFVRGYVFYNSV